MHVFASREIFNVKKNLGHFTLSLSLFPPLKSLKINKKEVYYNLGFKMYSIKCQNSAKNEIVKQEGGNI